MKRLKRLIEELSGEGAAGAPPPPTPTASAPQPTNAPPTPTTTTNLDTRSYWDKVVPKASRGYLFLIVGVVMAIGVWGSYSLRMVWPTAVAIGMLLTYIIYGIETIEAGDNAAYMVLGEPTHNLSPGPVLVLTGITEVMRLTSTSVHFIVGAKTTKEGSVIVTKPVGDEMVITDGVLTRFEFPSAKTAQNQPPLKWNQKGEITEWGEKWLNPDEDDPFDRSLACSPVVAVLLRINDPCAFLESARSLENAFGNISRIVQGVISLFAGKNSLRFCMAHMDTVLETIRRQTEWVIGDPDAIERAGGRTENRPWGADIEQVLLIDIGISYDLNRKQQDAAEARFAKQATIQAGEGEKRRLELVGQGHAAAAHAMQAGHGEQMTKYLAGLDAAVRMFEKAKMVITPPGEGVANLLAQGMVIGEQLEKLSDKNGEGKPDTNKGGKTT